MLERGLFDSAEDFLEDDFVTFFVGVDVVLLEVGGGGTEPADFLFKGFIDIQASDIVVFGDFSDDIIILLFGFTDEGDIKDGHGHKDDFAWVGGQDFPDHGIEIIFEFMERDTVFEVVSTEGDIDQVGMKSDYIFIDPCQSVPGCIP